MSEFPLDPTLSKVLIASQQFGCVREMTIIVAMLSVPSIFYRPKDKEAEADSQRQKMMIPESDHLTLWNAYRLWEESDYSKSFAE